MLLARAVMEQTEHALIVDPDVAFLERHGFQPVERGYFITESRRQQLERVLDGRAAAARHGTVGAVARDADGRVAAATSTGGMVGQADGRVGDSPIVGAGVYARDNVVAISGTGHGEAFIRGVVAYDIAARIRYAGAGLAAAVRETIETELAQRGSTGGIIAVGGDGRDRGGAQFAGDVLRPRRRPRACDHDMTDTPLARQMPCRCGPRSSSGWTSSPRPNGRSRAPCSPAIRRPGSRARPRSRRRRGRASQPCCGCSTGSGSAATRSSSSACGARSPAR